MARQSFAGFSIALFATACASNPPPASESAPAAATASAEAVPAPLTYPQTRKGDQIDDYHGTQVADPYRWLEDLDAEETRTWVDAQNKVTFGYLENIGERDRIRERLTTLWNFERYGLPYKEGGRYFFSKNDGLQNQSVVYTMEKLGDAPKVLMDPNGLSDDGTVALSGSAISPDGKLYAYGLAAAGSDWQEWHVRDVETGKDLPDHIKWVKFSGASWTKDAKGFYYSRYEAPKAGDDKLEVLNLNQKLYFHRLGSDQAEDELVYERPDNPKWMFDGDVTDDGRYLIVDVGEGTERKNGVFYRDLRRKRGKMVELLKDFDADYNFIDNDGPIFWFRTDLDAPRGKVIAVDIRKPDRKNWKTVVPETAETLRGVNVVGDRFIATYLKDARSQIKVLGLDGKLEREVELPGLGTAYGFGGKRKDQETFFGFEGYAQPSTAYRYDVKTGKTELFRAPTVAFNPADYETKQVFVTSKDGTKVPMFVTHKKGLEMDGKRPTYLYGYGGFNIALTPGFSVPNMVWLEMGGVLAVPNLRGGGEYGEAWHEAGTKLKKQNVFDDFIASAEWLIANGVTSKEKLAIGGRSNGGLLVGATVTQRPDLFRAALPGVGVMDMLRFHKFTIGWAWVSDYGSAENPEEFKALYAYSPLHNVKPGTAFPSMLAYTADHDDRVVPGHSYKFMAAVQAAHQGPNPVLIRIDVRAGHGAGKPTSKRIEEWADLWGFLVHELDMTL